MEITTKEFIRKKRDKERLTLPEIQDFIGGVANGIVTDDQLAAFAMAVFLNGMDDSEILAMTSSMKNSGSVLQWSLNGPVADKHSTGGVGDKVSLMLAPMAAACGCYVPMISGRGLGHTGGTLDKLESIPGYNTSPDIDSFQRIVAEIGCCIIGQTSEMAPADKRLYAVRDATSTVESIPLITSSILSKKLCSGIGALTMDIKAGNGAFLQRLEDAQSLGRKILQVARLDGIKAGGLITDMNQVLGSTAGNAVEVIEAIEFLTGTQQEPRLLEVTLELTANMLEVSGLADSYEKAMLMAKKALDSGAAAEIFAKMVVACGGPANLMEDYELTLPHANVVAPIASLEAGVVSEMHLHKIGEALIALGGGRNRKQDKLDHSVGFSRVVPLGQRVQIGEPLAYVHAHSSDDVLKASKSYTQAVKIADKASPGKPIIERLI